MAAQGPRKLATRRAEAPCEVATALRRRHEVTPRPPRDGADTRVPSERMRHTRFTCDCASAVRNEHVLVTERWPSAEGLEIPGARESPSGKAVRRVPVRTARPWPVTKGGTSPEDTGRA